MRRISLAFVILWLWGPPGLWGRDAEDTALSISNHTEGEEVRYPVILLKGRLPEAYTGSIVALNTSSYRDSRRIEGTVYRGQFKVLAELVKGQNQLQLRAGDLQHHLTINYRPQTNPYQVRMVYLTDKSGGTDYQTPFANNAQNFRGKLDTALKLMQTFTAERMNDLGFGRVTFNLELNAAGRVKVHLLAGEHSRDDYYKMSGLDLYYEAYRLVDRKLPGDYSTHLVIPSFTRFDPNQGKPLAHTALGGGNVALFGGGCLFAWPSSLNQAARTFMDDTLVDHTRYFSDSVGRHTVWAIASTTLGAALHELGHTFGLPHSKHPHDIMTRGMDRFNRVFTCIEPPHAARKERYTFSDDQVACWAPASAAWLKFTRWLALDKKSYADRDLTRITLDQPTQRIFIESRLGIGGVILTAANGDARQAFPVPAGIPAAQTIEVPLDEFGPDLEGAKTAVRVIDTHGLSRSMTLEQLRLAERLVRRWRFVPDTRPWQSPTMFVPLDQEELDEIAEAAVSETLSVNPNPYVNFLEQFPAGRQSPIAGYAVRHFYSNRDRTVHILTGSDDALRVWLNGELVTEILALRRAQMDTESNPARLRAGWNTLIAEVSQAGGDWGLYLRIDDQNGRGLMLTDDGRLTEMDSPASPKI